ncbi:hypothetical protein [Thermocladium modestius]|nr:hypothetical protein [Thermocladium modestius]
MSIQEIIHGSKKGDENIENGKTNVDETAVLMFMERRRALM